MFRKILRNSFAILILIALVSGSIPVQAQEILEPTPPVDLSDGRDHRPDPYSRIQPQQSPEGLWYVSGGDGTAAQTDSLLSPTTTGGPDAFGYTWDDAVSLAWLDVSSGTNAGLSPDVDHTGPITLNFPFKYYENTYTQLFISLYGFVSFSESNLDGSVQSEVPSSEPPNNVIAPHWTFFDEVRGYIRYKSGGSEPNRWFAVEWNRVYESSYYNTFTFEVILYENGDIVFQYGTMSIPYNDYWCQSSGIEDAVGLDGLMITEFCEPVASDHDVRIYRPAPSARAKIFPLHQGDFTSVSSEKSFQIPITNAGDLGVDTFDILASSSWPVSLYSADGRSPLSDTDSDGIPDTGSLPQGASTTIIAKIMTPDLVAPGDDNTAILTVRSSINPAVNKETSLDTAVPAPFAQVYYDQSDGAMMLQLSQPSQTINKKITPDLYFGYHLATAETPGGNFVYAWRKSRRITSTTSIYVYEIEYLLLDPQGNIIRPLSKLVDHSLATLYTYDELPAVSVSPDGHIGFAWMRRIRSSDYLYNYNIYFALLDAAGNLVYGPTNLTNNNLWGYSFGVPRFSNPRITATGDNRFAIAWESYTSTENGSIDDIYLAIRDNQNNPILPATKFTDGNPELGQYYGEPAVSALRDNRVLLAYSGGSGLSFAVLDSSGSLVKTPVEIDPFNVSAYTDAVQLSDGNIVLAWTGWDFVEDRYDIFFALVDGSSYEIATPPTRLPNTKAVNGNGYVSVTADPSGHAVLTWMDFDYYFGRHLYYALVGSNGSILTPAMVFRTAQPPSYSYGIATSTEGYGNTSYSSTTTTSGVDTYLSTHSLVTAPPEGIAYIHASFGNNGATEAASVVITATLDPALSYVDDTLGVIPTIDGNLVTWVLPATLPSLARGNFYLRVSTPDAPVGMIYPLSLGITASEEEIPVDNLASLSIVISNQLFLPVVAR